MIMVYQHSRKQCEVDLLIEEIGRLDCEIDSLLEKRARLRCHLNQLQTYTSMLPTETLSLIFQHTCALAPDDEDANPYPPVILGAVSTHWRRVVWSTSSLWTALAIKVKHVQYASTATISLLRLYLENAGTRCVSLRIDVPEDAYDENEEEAGDGQVPVAELFHLALQHPERIKELCCDYFWPRWCSIVTAYANTKGVPMFSNLEHLHLGIQAPDTPETLAEGEIDSSSLSSRVPRLDNVSLLGGVPPIPLPWEQITTLSLDSIPIDRCMALLKRCPNLTDYHCRRVLDTSVSEPLLRSTLTLKHVECFGWTFGYSQWDFALFKYVQLPLVERFKCERKHQDMSCDVRVRPSELLLVQKQFFSNMTTLADFERSSAHCITTEAVRLLRCLPSSVEDLHLVDVDDGEGNQISQILTLKEDSQDSILPRLSMLSTTGTFLNNLWMTMPDGTFTGMIRSRREGSEKKWQTYSRLSCIYLSCKRDEVAPDELVGMYGLSISQQAELQVFVDDGLRLVTTDSAGEATVWKPSNGTP
ncbi:hypothetical protein P691DRAFT_576396 [Macrolepiota fuliginosa MF-IS2]|uniref:F-box domain-containing protein n=1 Tax=Macrolepiota fuliginosa MF-IS2 TaxID=1400762 RepID=A0A9P6C249_9AGAR|nr:hypothetical protein P691DRAFT_576396 [Macrolepiota fuliginosa MF-IS2]